MPLDLEAIRKRCDAATKGPWRDDGRCNVLAPNGDWVAATFSGDRLPNEERAANTAFAAHARTDIPTLLSALEESQAENAAERSIISDPDVCFGAPQIRGAVVEILAGRVNAGDSVEETAEDFGVSPLQVRAAVAWWNRLGRGLVHILDIAEREKEAAYQDRDTAERERTALHAENARLREAGKELANGNRLCDLMQDEDLQRLCAVFGVTVETRMGAALEGKP